MSWILAVIGFGGSGGASGRPDFAPNPEPNGGFQKHGLSRIPGFDEKHQSMIPEYPKHVSRTLEAQSE